MRIREQKQFKKDLKKIEKQNKDIDKLDEVIWLLATNKTLDPKYLDHPLYGNYKNYRECHIEPDWLLIYKVSDDTLNLARTGSHSELFS